tara:strand:+ start:6377 stop:6907 length:531 start_codon:yes stop_codon:yes gene_type:complete
MPFIVGVGDISNEEISIGSLALSRFWAGSFRKLSCNESPDEVISSLSKDVVEGGLFQLIGDASFVKADGCSWLEALGAWKIPTILMVLSRSDGQVPGTSSAYVALCKYLSIPLIGIVQLGGDWDSKRRSLDGLPWCGNIPIKKIRDVEINSMEYASDLIEIEEVALNIKRKMKSIH